MLDDGPIREMPVARQGRPAETMRAVAVRVSDLPAVGRQRPGFGRCQHQHARRVVVVCTVVDPFGTGRHRALAVAEQCVDDQQREPDEITAGVARVYVDVPVAVGLDLDRLSPGVVRWRCEKVDALVPDGFRGFQARPDEFADEPVPPYDLDLLRIQVPAAHRCLLSRLRRAARISASAALSASSAYTWTVSVEEWPRRLRTASMETPSLMSSVAWLCLSWWMPMSTPAAVQYF